jgi:hypothetical protein
MIAPQQKPKTFPLGRTLATPGALEVLSESGESPADFLDRHARCDWGDLDEHDRQANDEALVTGARLLSAYHTSSTSVKLWVITEADRSATTILLPDEY